ncbi:MAG: hypothetical protein U9N49_07655, partial [Campylobacterota bacterium]|nr:hypothetical protein [Campylobacterota bacterium]
EDIRVEYFMINPTTQEELIKTQLLCQEIDRFYYTLPIEFKELQDDNALALRITSMRQLDDVKDIPLVIESDDLDDTFIDALNATKIEGVILNAKQSDSKLSNFAYAISSDSMKEWDQVFIGKLDYAKLAVQSDYPTQDYDAFIDDFFKKLSDLTFRAEQTIAAGGTRTLLKTFGLL